MGYDAGAGTQETTGVLVSASPSATTRSNADMNDIPAIPSDTQSFYILPDAILRRDDLMPAALVKAIENYQTGTVQDAVDAADKMLTRRQAATILQTSMPTLYRLHRQGDIRFVHFGRRNVRIPFEDVSRILDAANASEK